MMASEIETALDGVNLRELTVMALDADDLRAPAEVATATDWATAKAAVSLIEERGYAGGRDLAAALATLHESGAY